MLASFATGHDIPEWAEGSDIPKFKGHLEREGCQKFYHLVTHHKGRNLLGAQKCVCVCVCVCVCMCVCECSVVSDSLQPHGLYPARLMCPWGFSRQENWRGLPWPP